MAYRINAQFKDGSTSGRMTDVVAAPPPRRGDTLSLSHNGMMVSVRVTAVWTPALKLRHVEGLSMVEAEEI